MFARLWGLVQVVLPVLFELELPHADQSQQVVNPNLQHNTLEKFYAL